MDTNPCFPQVEYGNASDRPDSHATIGTSDHERSPDSSLPLIPAARSVTPSPKRPHLSFRGPRENASLTLDELVDDPALKQAGPPRNSPAQPHPEVCSTATAWSLEYQLQIDTHERRTAGYRPLVSRSSRRRSRRAARSCAVEEPSIETNRYHERNRCKSKGVRTGGASSTE